MYSFRDSYVCLAQPQNISELIDIGTKNEEFNNIG